MRKILGKTADEWVLAHTWGQLSASGLMLLFAAIADYNECSLYKIIHVLDLTDSNRALLLHLCQAQ